MEWSWCSCTSSPTTSCAVSTIPTIDFPIILTSAPSTRNTLGKSPSSSSQILRHPLTKPVCPRFRVRSKVTESEFEINPSKSSEVDCIGTGLDVECVFNPTDDLPGGGKEELVGPTSSLFEMVRAAWKFGLLLSPFFFWGTALVATKEVLPKTGPFFMSAFRLIPSGFLLIAFAASRGRGFPSGFRAWLSISAFALVDASCFQGFLAEGLEKTSAGLGSVIIDSQPLTVAILASLLFGESMGPVGAVGLVLGVIGLLLLEVPALYFDKNNFSLWGSGEWWMLLAAQSMAIGTVMVRWVSKYSDPVMATGWLRKFGRV